MIRVKILAVGCLLVIGQLLACQSGGAAEPMRQKERVTLLLHWGPQAQFAGYLMAQERGVFARHGLDVTIVYKDPDLELEELLRHDSEIDFHTNYLLSAMQISERLGGFVNLMQSGRHSGMAFVVRRDSGIELPIELSGKKVAIWTGGLGELQRLFLKSHGIDCRLVEFGSGVELFLRRAVDAMAIMTYNEYYSIISAGLNPEELNLFPFRDYGMDFPEDGLYCRREFYERKPELCRRLADAAREGWLLAFADREATLAAIKRQMLQAHHPFSLSHQRWMLDTLAKLYADGALSSGGYLDPAGFRRARDFLLENGKLREAITFQEWVPEPVPRPEAKAE